jgi:hypothetical protein
MKCQIDFQSVVYWEIKSLKHSLVIFFEWHRHPSTADVHDPSTADVHAQTQTKKSPEARVAFVNKDFTDISTSMRPSLFSRLWYVSSSHGRPRLPDFFHAFDAWRQRCTLGLTSEVNFLFKTNFLIISVLTCAPCPLSYSNY